MQPQSQQNQAPYFQQPPINPYQNQAQYINPIQPPQPVFAPNQQVQGQMILQP
jgi:hypothetical protein